jgi:hypothetical protein
MIDADQLERLARDRQDEIRQRDQEIENLKRQLVARQLALAAALRRIEAVRKSTTLEAARLGDFLDDLSWTDPESTYVAGFKSAVAQFQAAIRDLAGGG